MHPFFRWLMVVLFVFPVSAAQAATAPIRAGAFAADISPTHFPVRVNAMFTERTAGKVVDPLFAKALALEDGETRLVICVVDSCMVPRELLDRAKAEASRITGIPVERMLVSSTHTHSAPSAMGCLGSRVDPGYAAFLPGQIAAAITGAVARLAPARVGWAQVDDWEHTFNRRWIRRPDKLLTDPFGQRNVRAHMHPGHESPDVTGPSGPVDPQLSVLAVQRADGKPLAILANYSQHYYGSPLLSSDYYGRFARHVATMLGADESFVGIMSQGTSGDLMWMDYAAPRREIGYDAYAKEIAARVTAMVRAMQWQEVVPLKMAERKLELGYRVPDEKRLDWAREMAAKLGDKLPQSQPEIYALEAIYLHERPRTELRIQALRIGELGIAALPNEVYAITGLKLKQRSPFAATFNIGLANGAEGYIPPPEQHRLGGYTTWPARTAGLETNAEPRIVETALALLEEVSGRPRREPAMEHGLYARAVLEAKPVAYWRFEEIVIPTARDATGRHDATVEDGVALFLPGADGRVGHQPAQPPLTNAFSGSRINRAAHFAGGRVRAHVPLGENYSLELWLWNGLPADARAVTGYVFSRGLDGDKAARGEHLGIGGTYRADLTGKLILFNGNERNEVLAGQTKLSLRQWHHVVFVREGNNVRVYLDGRRKPEISGVLEHTVPEGVDTLFIGGRNDGLFNFEGKLDEVALYSRALTPDEVAAHFDAAAIKGSFPLVPRPVGEWWTIAGDPDLGELTTPRQQPVDFGIWQAADGTWQLWSCIRNTKEPGNTRLFHRWEGARLTDANWTPRGIAMQADPALGETRGGLQAPYVIRHDGKFWMFYGDWVNICLATSADGKKFTRHQNREGKPQLEVAGEVDRTRNGRDPMVLNAGGKWHLYYTAHPGRKGFDYARTSEDLIHWSEERVVAAGGRSGDGPYSAECPFVAEPQPGHFYLFRTQVYGRNAQTMVYHSRDPLDFGVNNDAEHFVTTLPVAAPEIFRHEGQWYMAALLPSLKGIQVTRMEWVPVR